MAFREQVMYGHANEAIAASDGHATLWAHHIHLARDDEKLTSHYGAVGPACFLWVIICTINIRVILLRSGW